MNCDIHNLRVKETPSVTFGKYYCQKFDRKKKKTFASLASKVSEDLPEYGIVLYSLLISLSNPNKKSFVKYLTCRSILHQRVGDLHLSQLDNNVLHNTRNEHVNYFIAQSRLYETLGQRVKSLDILNHGLELHPFDPIITQRIENLSKKKIKNQTDGERITKTSPRRVEFMRIPSFLRPKHNENTKEQQQQQGEQRQPTKRGARLTDIPMETFQYLILPHFEDLDLLKISQVCFNFRNSVAEYYERKHKGERLKFRTFIRDEYTSKKKIKEFIEYGRYFDLLFSYCFRILSSIEEKIDLKDRIIIPEPEKYSIYTRELGENESLFGISQVPILFSPTTTTTTSQYDYSKVKKIYQSVLCREAKEFYKVCDGVRKESTNFQNIDVSYKKLVQTTWDYNKILRGVGVFPDIGGILSLLDYREAISKHEGASSKQHKKAKHCVFLGFRISRVYEEYTYNFILDNKKSDVLIEGWQIDHYSYGTTNMNYGRFGSFFATLYHINHHQCLILEKLVDRIISKGGLLMKKK